MCETTAHAWAFQKASLCMVGTHSSHTREVYLIILCHRIHVATRILDCAISFMVGVFSALSSGCTVIMPFAGFVFLSVFSSSADTRVELVIALEQRSFLGTKWVLGEPVIQLPLLLGDSVTSEKDAIHF